MNENKLFDATKVSNGISDGYRRPSGPPWKSIVVLILRTSFQQHSGKVNISLGSYLR